MPQPRKSICLKLFFWSIGYTKPVLGLEYITFVFPTLVAPSTTTQESIQMHFRRLQRAWRGVGREAAKRQHAEEGNWALRSWGFSMARKDKPIDFIYDTITGLGQPGDPIANGKAAGAGGQASFLRASFPDDCRTRHCKSINYQWARSVARRGRKAVRPHSIACQKDLQEYADIHYTKSSTGNTTHLWTVYLCSTCSMLKTSPNCLQTHQKDLNWHLAQPGLTFPWLQANNEEEAYISLLDVVDDKGDGDLKPAGLQNLAIQDIASPVASSNETFVFKAQSADDNSQPKELPWSKASKQIKSPSLRLHHGQLPSWTLARFLHVIYLFKKECWEKLLLASYSSTSRAWMWP